MRVYHGSYVEVAEPDIIHSRKKIDFGIGFYVTPIEEQAKNWSDLHCMSDDYIAEDLAEEWRERKISS